MPDEKDKYQIADLKAEISKLTAFQYAASGVGATIGIIYSIYMERSFLKSVGNFILGSILVGGITAIYTSPKIAEAKSKLSSLEGEQKSLYETLLSQK